MPQPLLGADKGGPILQASVGERTKKSIEAIFDLVRVVLFFWIIWNMDVISKQYIFNLF